MDCYMIDIHISNHSDLCKNPLIIPQISLDLLAEVDTIKLSVPQKARFYYLQASNFKFRREDSEAYPLLLKAKVSKAV